MLLPFSAAQMYEVVSDVGAYVEYLPGCESSEVLSRSEQEMTARLVIGKGGIRQSLTTKNRLVPGERIELGLLEGPFSHFSGTWQFLALETDEGVSGCRVSLDAEFDFESMMLNLTLGKLLKANTDKVIDAFYRRAIQLYG